MATTYTLLGGGQISSGLTQYTFSNISTGYDDLLVKYSIRATGNYDNYFRLNNSSSAYYQYTRSYTTGSSGGANRYNNQTSFGLYGAYSDNDANVFSSGQIYLPNYNAVTYHNVTWEEIIGENGTSGWQFTTNYTGVFDNAQAITRIDFFQQNDFFAAGSSFWLYGIKRA